MLIFAVGFRRDVYNVIFTFCCPIPEEFVSKVPSKGLSFRTGADLILLFCFLAILRGSAE